MRSFPRHTVRQPFTVAGLGLHTGVPVSVTVHPGDQGIGFRYGGTRVLAHPANVTDTTRSTKLGEVGTVEHLMSAFAGLEITDAEVELDAPELPGLDGSAGGYIDAIMGVGIEQIGDREFPSLYTRLFLQEDGGPKMAIGKGNGQWRFVFATDDRWPGEQAFELEDAVGGYVEHIARARTFAFAEEVPMIIQLGLGRGLDENSALILGIEGYKNEPRYPDEPARHKLLDLMGDLYLAGVPVRALNVVSERSGHRANVKAAAMLAQAMGNTQPAT
ncbi:UDP-3-O-acyl-N-acetylglucosamine deacetylase [Fimbriimonas ginsengisoli]|uniref:UDP-3-O-acyl-N-acetylglucosamine deacetylase n=1 Tax=Fimbriimonas ginsengisoli Gsoil 348 TaxID=661478 RepID=A0A068NR04_FIMGI|nr:UDP-3-O-acyl-N-acetylglucosamine deacetylase [Fimbriimonas ginsengisoli]AIE85180.1 UDP-3-O-[3-hydroxymyristoyl] N-acetylglucosamine deacetylase [Fimbriimonas ginsengisoli Gsoil 348]